MSGPGASEKVDLEEPVKFISLDKASENAMIGKIPAAIEAEGQLEVALARVCDQEQIGTAP